MLCKHLNAYITGELPVGQMYCPQCRQEIPMEIIINNLTRELRHYIKILEELRSERDAKSSQENNNTDEETYYEI